MLNDSDERHDDGQVREATLDAGGLLIYDTENEDAWIQSDSPTDVG